MSAPVYLPYKMSTPMPDHYGAGRETRARSLAKLTALVATISTLILLTKNLVEITEADNDDETKTPLEEPIIVLRHCTKMVVELENILGTLIEPELQQNLSNLLDQYSCKNK